MLIPQKYYSLSQERYEEDIKYSLHSYLYKSIKNNQIDTIETKIKDNVSSLNEPDLYGKYCSLNFLLDNFIFHYNNKGKYYYNKNFLFIDCLYVTQLLLDHHAHGLCNDYKKMSYYDNLIFIEHETESKWLCNHEIKSLSHIIHHDSIKQQLIYELKNKQSILDSFHHQLFLNLQLNLKTHSKQKMKI